MMRTSVSVLHPRPDDIATRGAGGLLPERSRHNGLVGAPVRIAEVHRNLGCLWQSFDENCLTGGGFPAS